MPRSPKISAELHQDIRDMWVYNSMSCQAIANALNNDKQKLSKYGQIDQSGVFYHVKQIRDELESVVSEDALDTYVAEFIRLKESMDRDIEAVDELIKEEKESEKPSRELLLKMMRQRHEYKLNKMKLLQDVELPIRVKKLKRERDRRVKVLNVSPQPLDVKIDGEGSSRHRDEEDN